MKPNVSIKKNYGQQVVDHRSKLLTQEDHITEYYRLMERDIIRDIEAVIKDALTSPLFQHKDFYVGIYNRIEQMGANPRRWVKARLSPQTPIFNTTLFKFRHESGNIELMWVLPDQIRYWDLWNNRHMRLQEKQWEALTKFVVLDQTGELLKWTQKENNEDPSEKVIAIKVEKDLCQKNSINP